MGTNEKGNPTNHSPEAPRADHPRGTACQTGLQELHGTNSVTKITRKKTSTKSKVAGLLSNDDSMTGHR